MGAYYAESRRHLSASIARYLDKGSIIEVGCGLGHVSQGLAQALPDMRVSGMDISPTAIERARALYPELEFLVGDIAASGLSLPRRYDVLLLNQILWYVLERLDTVLDNAVRHLAPGGFLVICNAFLPEQKYGRDLVDGFDGLLRYLLGHRLTIIDARIDISERYAHRDGLVFAQVA